MLPSARPHRCTAHRPARPTPFLAGDLRFRPGQGPPKAPLSKVHSGRFARVARASQVRGFYRPLLIKFAVRTVHVCAVPSVILPLGMILPGRLDSCNRYCTYLLRHPHAHKEEDEAHIFFAVVQAEHAWPNAPSSREDFARISKTTYYTAPESVLLSHFPCPEGINFARFLLGMPFFL